MCKCKAKAKKRRKRGPHTYIYTQNTCHPQTPPKLQRPHRHPLNRKIGIHIQGQQNKNGDKNRETSDHHKKQREGTTAPTPAQAPPTPRTTHTHTHLHTKPPQQPIEEPQQQRTLTNTTTMDTQHSTPSARDENMTEENTAALRDPRITPKPPNWPQMTKKQRRNWFKHKLGGREEEGEERPASSCHVKAPLSRL